MLITTSVCCIPLDIVQKQRCHTCAVSMDICGGKTSATLCKCIYVHVTQNQTKFIGTDVTCTSDALRVDEGASRTVDRLDFKYCSVHE